MAAVGTTQIKDSEPEGYRPEDDVYDLLDQGRFLQQGADGKDNESNEEARGFVQDFPCAREPGLS